MDDERMDWWFIGWVNERNADKVNGQTDEWLDRDCCSTAWQTDNRKNEYICGSGVSSKREFDTIFLYQS